MQSQLFTVLAHEELLARIEDFALGVSAREPQLSARTELELQNLCWASLRAVYLALRFRDWKKTSCLKDQRREIEVSRIPPVG